MWLSDLREIGGRLEASGLKTFTATCTASLNELGSLLIDENLKAKIREILLIKNCAIQLEIKECKNIPNELHKMGASISRLNSAVDFCSFLNVFSDTIYLVVLCQDKQDNFTLVDEILKQIKNPRFIWQVWFSVDGDVFEDAKDRDELVLAVSHFHLDFRIKS